MVNPTVQLNEFGGFNIRSGENNELLCSTRASKAVLDGVILYFSSASSIPSVAGVTIAGPGFVKKLGNMAVTAAGEEVDLAWTLVTDFNVSGNSFLEDRRAELRSYFVDNNFSLVFRREYHGADGRIYQIFTKNSEKRGGVDFGHFKHLEHEAWSTEVDYGTQLNTLDSRHQQTSRQGQGRWEHGVQSRERNVVKSKDGHCFRASGPSAYTHNATWGPCYGGGLKDSVSGLVATGVAENHRFEVNGPEGSAPQAYSATANISSVKIWVKKEM